MVADSSDENPKGNDGVEKKERAAGQFFHVGDKGEQVDGSAKVGAELHPLDFWVLDTGAAWTMTPRKDLLDDVRAAPINEVCSASGHPLKVAGSERAALKGADGTPVVVHDVLFVPDLRKLAKAGIHVAAAGVGVACRATAHQRLGHVAMPLLKQLEKDGAVKGLKLNGQPPDDNCEICLLSKFTRFPFHSVAGRSKKPLELVHMDLVGPLPVQGHKEERYFFKIVDDWSKLMWVYPLKQKNNAISTLRDDWLPFVEKQSNCVLKRIRTDRGGEFFAAETTAWLKKQGI
ncbi:unnamed protein product [Closterium sp. Yama58-4]|nr:unnamed protein product [Closterium sp. Yama58-4]